MPISQSASCPASGRLSGSGAGPAKNGQVSSDSQAARSVRMARSTCSISPGSSPSGLSGARIRSGVVEATRASPATRAVLWRDRWRTHSPPPTA
ncbi:hypothetical protein ABZ471_27565 [Streptomyces sp. NPDC005728]|uniref:hypothetical protein n=1 Tax=Streptomyces sp. NPDC005728 TaxID=3157054 RepID=UPI0033D029C9